MRGPGITRPLGEAALTGAGLPRVCMQAVCQRALAMSPERTSGLVGLMVHASQFPQGENVSRRRATDLRSWALERSGGSVHGEAAPQQAVSGVKRRTRILE
jgi:hypothetical protein